MAASRILFATLARNTRKYSSQPVLNAAQSGHGPEAIKMWKNISFFVAFPAIVICAINTYLKHMEHASHGRPEFIPYEHLRIRTKRFPWGDGTKSFFHNPHVNALPNGYEDDH